MKGYREIRDLGPAQYGRIVLSEHKASQTKVVIKKLGLSCVRRKVCLNGNKSPEDNINGAKLLGALAAAGDHPNVVTLREVITHEKEDLFAVVLDYYEQGDMYAKIKRGRINEIQARKAFYQMLSGLQHCHSHGLGHLDVSLENFLIDANGDLCLSDFGLCVDKDVMTTNMRVGKDLYAAPECHNMDKPFNAFIADAWSAGVCLFMCLTGTPPVHCAKQNDRCFGAIASGKLRKLVKSWNMDSYFSEQSIDLVSGLLTADPSKRLKLSEALEHPWLASERKRSAEIRPETPSRLHSSGTVDTRRNPQITTDDEGTESQESIEEEAITAKISAAAAASNEHKGLRKKRKRSA